MISDELIYDEDFNRLSLEAQSLFMRMLSKSDDCGIVPANEYSLTQLTNPPPRVRKALPTYLNEIVTAQMGIVFEHAGKSFFAFKRESFDRIQSYVINKRTKSEYLNLEENEALSLISEKFLESPRNSTENGSSPIESRKQRVESREYKAESRKGREFVAPTVDEVVAYFTKKGFPESTARRAFDYYNDADWIDSQGHKVRSWKQKMIAVWMKEENRNGASQNHQGGNSRSGKKSGILPGDVERAAELATRINTVRSGT